MALSLLPSGDEDWGILLHNMATVASVQDIDGHFKGWIGEPSDLQPVQPN